MEAIFPRAAASRLQLRDQPFAAILHIEDFSKFGDLPIDNVHRESCRANTITAAGIILAYTIRWRRIGRNAQFLKLFRSGHDSHRADMPLKISRHDIRLLRQYALKTRIIVRKPFHLCVHILEALEDRAKPDRRPHYPVAEPETVEYLGAALANRDRTVRCMCECNLAATISER